MVRGLGSVLCVPCLFLGYDGGGIKTTPIPIGPSPEGPTVIPTPTPPVHNITQDKYHATIQAAIDDAEEGDKIVVRSENLHKPSIVASTVIDGGGTDTVVKFLNGKTQDATLEGFTIPNGRGTAKVVILLYFGGRIYIENASSTITKNVIRDNHVTSAGGGIYVGRISSPKIVDNTIEGNTANLSGGELFVGNATGVKRASGTPWGKSLCPLDGTQAGTSWIYRNNTLSSNTHQGGQDSKGCHVSMVI